MQMPNSILMRSFLAALVLATSVAASASIYGSETTTGLVDDGLIAARRETPSADYAVIMGIVVETMQIAGQLSGYTQPPDHQTYLKNIPAAPLTPGG
jgi:hypothetical protein